MLRVYDMLSNINPNKAIGPDKIHGRILKNCAFPLYRPLSYLFTKSYYGMSIPYEWKAASVVPVYKKNLHQMFKTIAQSH